MTFIVKDRVRETSTTSGTGNLTLMGAVTGFQGFSAIGNGNTTYYCIAGAADWEVGVGTVVISGSTVLQRTSVLASSNGGSLVNFSSEPKQVFVTNPAERSISGVSGQLQIPNPGTTGNLLTSTGSDWNSSVHTGWIHENTVTANGTSVVAILTKSGNQPLTFANETYAVVLRDVCPASGAGSILLRMSVNSTGSVSSSSIYRSGYDFGWTNSLPTSTVTSITATPALVSASGKINGVLYFSYDSVLPRINITGFLSFYDAISTGRTSTGDISGSYNSSTFYGIAFLVSASNISGSFDLYKLVRA